MSIASDTNLDILFNGYLRILQNDHIVVQTARDLSLLIKAFVDAETGTIPGVTGNILIDGADTTLGFAGVKIVGDGSTILTNILNPGGNEQLQIMVGLTNLPGVGPTALGSGGSLNLIARADQTSPAYRSDLPLSTVWYIDPTNGSDDSSNPGTTSAAALKTVHELARRWWGAEITQVTTINVLGDIPPTDVAGWNTAIATHVTVNWVGSLGPTTGFGGAAIDNTLYTGTVTGFVAASPTPAADDIELTDSAIPTSYTASGLMAEGVLFKRISSAAFYWYGLKDLGSKTLRTTAPMNQIGNGPPMNSSLTIGDAYSAFHMWTIPSQFFGSANQRMTFDSLWMNDLTVNLHGASTGRAARTWFAGGQAVLNFDTPGGNLANCMFSGGGGLSVSIANSEGTILGIVGGGARVTGSSSSMLFFQGSGSCLFQGAFISQGMQISSQDYFSISIEAAIAVHDTTTSMLGANLGTIGFSFTPIPGVGMSGKGNSGKLLLVQRIGRLVFGTGSQFADPPFVAGSTSDTLPIQIGSTSYALATLPPTSLGLQIAEPNFPSTVFETGGLARLTYAAVPDGSYLKRSGVTIIGDTTTYLPDPGSNGIVVRTGLGTDTARTIVAGNSTIIVTNGDGVSGNPTITGGYAAGSGVTITGNVIAATGSGGTVTNVSGLAPIFVTSPTTTPVISIQGSIVSGSTSTTAQNIGLLGSGVIEGVTSGGINTLTSFAVGTNLIPFGSGISGGLTNSANLAYLSGNQLVNISPSTVNSAATFETAIVSIGSPTLSVASSAVSGAQTLISLSNPGGLAGWRLDSSNNSFFFTGTAGKQTFLTGGDVGVGTSALVLTAGNVQVPSLSTGGIVFAAATTGQLGLITIGSGISFTGGTLSATGSGGTVTTVTGTSPIFITSTQTTTPNVTIQGSIVSGSTSTTAQNLGSLTTGILKGTVSAGISTISTAISGTDYQPPGNYITALTTDVTATGPGSVVATISVHAVTYAKMQQASTVTLLGNPTGGTANVQEITLGSGLSFSGSVLNATGGTGTVTTVTGTSPIFITSTPTTTPNVTIQGSIVSGSTSTTAQNLGALSSGILLGTVSTGTNTLSTLVIGTGLSLTSGTLSATGGGITSISVTAPITSTGGATPTIGITGVASQIQFGTGTNLTGSANLLFDTTNSFQLAQVDSSGFSLKLTSTTPFGGLQWIVKQGTGDLYIGTQSSQTVHLAVALNDRIILESNNDIVIGSGLTTSAISGWPYMSSSAGPPTITPTSYFAGALIAYQIDRTNDRLYAFNSSWKPYGQYDGSFGPAIIQTDSSGIHSAVTIGSGLTYSGGTLTATGGGGSGTVTTVTGTFPILITSTPTTTPNVTLQGGIVSGSSLTTPQNLGALTSGLLKGTIGSGINTISTATAGTDYMIGPLTQDVTTPSAGSAVTKVVAIHETSGPTQLTIAAIPDSAPDSTVLIRPAGTTEILGISGASFLSGRPAQSMSFKWSGLTGGSASNIGASAALIWSPGDAGMIQSSGGLMLNTFGGAAATCAGNYAAGAVLPAIYPLSSNFARGTFTAAIPFAAVTTANGVIVEFALFYATAPQTGSSYTSLAVLDSGTFTIGNNHQEFLPVNFTFSGFAGGFLVLTVYRIDSVTSAILSPMAVTATVTLTT